MFVCCRLAIWPQPFYCAVADSMLTVAIYEMTGILPTDPGYGYYRDHVQMFDPGWKGYQTKGPEDWNFDVFDKGNDPEGVLQRCVPLPHSQHEWHTISWLTRCIPIINAVPTSGTCFR